VKKRVLFEEKRQEGKNSALRMEGGEGSLRGCQGEKAASRKRALGRNGPKVPATSSKEPHCYEKTSNNER